MSTTSSTAPSSNATDKSSKPAKSTATSRDKSAKVPKLTLDSQREEDTKARNVAPLLRSVSQMLPSNLMPRTAASTLTSRNGPTKRVTPLATNTGVSTASTWAVRVFVTSDLTPHRFCALVIKSGWNWNDFLEAASAKLAGGNQTHIEPNSISAANAVFLHNGAEIGSLDDLREDDQILLRFQKRMSLAPGLLSAALAEGHSPRTEAESVDDRPSYIPMDGVFRILLPDLIDVSPLSFSEELVADLVQDELKHLCTHDSTHNPTTPPEQLSLRLLMRDLLLAGDDVVETILRTYDYLLPNHTFLSILIVHLRAPLVPMEATHINTGAITPRRPQPPQGRGATQALPTYGMSISMTDPIRRGSAQTKIVNVIGHWIELRYDSISEDLAALELLDDLVVYLCASPERLRAYGQQIAHKFKQARRAYASRERDLELCHQNTLPRDKISFTRAVEVTPFELACQLTLADQDIYLRLNLSELQALQFDMPDGSILSPHIVEWVKHSSFITSWVVASILGPPGEPNPGPKKRAQIVQHFIIAMDELRTLRSYNAMMQIYHALVHPAIDRLDATWEAVSPSHIAIKKSISDMIQPPATEYHRLIHVADPPAIPYIEYHLNELRHIEDSDTVLENGDISFSKLERLSKAFRCIVHLQHTTYNLIPNAAYMSFVRTFDVPPMSTLVELSLALEPDTAKSSTSASGRIVVRPTARTISDARSSSSGGNSDLLANSAGFTKSAKYPGSLKAKRKDSSAQKMVKEKEKEEEKKKKKWEKQAKKVRPLLTAALSLDQGILNNDIYEQFLSYSNDSNFINGLLFYKAVLEFKRMFGSDAEPAARRTREEASKIASTFLTIGSDRIPDFSSSLLEKVKEIEAKAKGEQNLFTNNIFDPLVADIVKMLNTNFVLFKAQATS